MKPGLVSAWSALLFFGTSLSSQAAFVIQGGSTQTLPVAGNRFNAELAGLGLDQMSSGARLRVTTNGYIDFYLVGADSRFNNRFSAQSSALSGNTVGFLAEHDEAFDFAGHSGFTIAVSANDFVDFSFTSDGVTALTPVDNFSNTHLQGLGIYVNSGGAGTLQQVVLGYDDQTTNDDNDFNDMLIRADFRAVPIPAAVWLFGSGLIALIVVAREAA